MARRSYAYTPQPGAESQAAEPEKAQGAAEVWDCPSKTPSPTMTPTKLRASAKRAAEEKSFGKSITPSSKNSQGEASTSNGGTPRSIEKRSNVKSPNTEKARFPVMTSRAPAVLPDGIASVNDLNEKTSRKILGNLTKVEFNELKQYLQDVFIEREDLLKLNVSHVQQKRVFVRSLNEHFKARVGAENRKTPSFLLKLQNSVGEGDHKFIGYVLYEISVRVRDAYCQELVNKRIRDIEAEMALRHARMEFDDNFILNEEEYPELDNSHIGDLDEIPAEDLGFENIELYGPFFRDFLRDQMDQDEEERRMIEQFFRDRGDRDGVYGAINAGVDIVFGVFFLILRVVFWLLRIFAWVIFKISGILLVVFILTNLVTLIQIALFSAGILEYPPEHEVVPASQGEYIAP